MGAELNEHLEAERLAKEKQAAQQAALERSRRMLEADDLDSDSDSDDDSITAADNLLQLDSANQRGGDNDVQMSFDIFVKGQQMRVARGREDQSGRFRMFPFLERRGRKVDDYGETLDVGQWVRKGKEIEEEGETQEVRDAKRKKQEEEERQQAPPEPPSKSVTETTVVDLRASVFYVDMDGLHDGAAIKTIVTDLQPRQLVGHPLPVNFCLIGRLMGLDLGPFFHRGDADSLVLPVDLERDQGSLRAAHWGSSADRTACPVVLIRPRGQHHVGSLGQVVQGEPHVPAPCLWSTSADGPV